MARRSWMRRVAPALALAAAVAAADGPEKPAVRVVDLAICLDTSGSMSGLIDAARQKLWAIVNDLALARPAPRLRVALLTFGNNGHPAAEGWVALDVPLTEDLDLVSQRLFALSTNGGEEYVGRVLQAAAERLDWTPAPEALRLIFVAGNESADQDREVPFRETCRKAIARGLQVNSIYCGNPADEIAPGWREVATLADGHFAAIDQDHGTVAVATPFDQALADLGKALNATYIPVGTQGREGAANQVAQDRNAEVLHPAAAAQRAATKASGLYVCSWDLVDACKGGQLRLEEVKEEDLPEAMRAMTPEERRAHVEETARRRAEIQSKIGEAEKKRKEHVSTELRRRGLDEGKAFDHAVRTAIRAQAEAKGFSFAEPPAPK